jgi:catechol 2,3-dioxygenase-like lactoylglutathione lyase family enzyme
VGERFSYATSHVGLCVRDLERSRRFYVDGLGFEEFARFRDHAAHRRGRPAVRLHFVLHSEGRTARRTARLSIARRDRTAFDAAQSASA